MAAKALTISLPEDVFARLEAARKAERRGRSNLVQMIVEGWLEEREIGKQRDLAERGRADLIPHGEAMDEAMEEWRATKAHR